LIEATSRLPEPGSPGSGRWFRSPDGILRLSCPCNSTTAGNSPRAGCWMTTRDPVHFTPTARPVSFRSENLRKYRSSRARAIG